MNADNDADIAKSTTHNWLISGISVISILATIALLFLIKWLLSGRRYRGRERLDGKVAIVTGSNTGLGKAHALDLAKRGARVYLACRNLARSELARKEIVQKSGNENVFNVSLDLGSLVSVRQFVKNFLDAEQHLHILVNNAAILPDSRQTTADGFEMQMGVNHLGPFLLTNLLLEVLRKSAPSRIVVVSSHAHYYGRINRDDLQAELPGAYRKFAQYGDTKLANVLMVRSLAQRLEGSGVTVNALHPGFVRTELTRSLWLLNCVMFVFTWFYRSPEQGAQTQIRLSVDPQLERVSGCYFDNCRQRRMAERALDPEEAEWMWQTSWNLVAGEKRASP